MAKIEHITACTMDCPDACSILVSSKDDGSISIKGNPEHPVTAGFTCRKIRNHGKRLQSPERILRPLIKTKSGWQPVSWDDALDLCAERIQEYRKEPSSILHIFGSGAKGVLKEATKLFFDRLGANRARGSLCDATGIWAYLRDFGSRDNHDLNDLNNAKAIINWGRDLSRTSIHTASVVRKARRNGVKVLTISPGGDDNETYSDSHVQIRPGSDRFLVSAVMKRFIDQNLISAKIIEHTKRWESFRQLILSQSEPQLIERCGVSIDAVGQVFEFYKNYSPVATLVGAGLQRYAHGGETVRFINALALVSGNIGISGGGSYFHHDAYRNLNLSWVKADRPKKQRSFRLPVIGEEILAAENPAIKMIWVNSINIVNQSADSKKIAYAFEKTPFKVVVEAFLTDTAERADLILPSTLMLEQEDIIGSYLHECVHYVRAVCGPPGEAKDDYSILFELGKRLDPPILMPERETCFINSLDSPFLDISLDMLKESHFTRANRPEVPYANFRFDHYDGKYRFPIELHPEEEPTEAFPFRLLSSGRRNAMHSQILPEDQKELPQVWVSPRCRVWDMIDIRKDIYLVSPKGRLKVCLNSSEGLHPETVWYRRGDWMKLGGGVNQLIEARLTDMGSGAAFYDQFVRLENG